VCCNVIFLTSVENLEWANEFAAQQPQSWAEEFNEENPKSVDITGDSKETLSKTAGLLIDVVEQSSNPKFKTSKFMDFMKQLRDQKVSIEGNKVVDNVEQVPNPASAASDWAKEFGVSGLKTSSWEEEFSYGETQPVGVEPAQSWADEFQGQSHQGNDIGMDLKNWADEFQASNPVDQVEAEQAWADEFAAHAPDLSLSTSEKEELENAYKEFYGSSANFSAAPISITEEEARAVEWEKLQKEWNDFEKENALVNDQRYNTYIFTSNNPYMNRPLEFLTNPLSHRNLTESILALEAAVQKDPRNAAAWKNLGLRQQENENEVAAIAALRASVRADPSVLESWLALSSSYTNEGLMEEAYSAIESWISNNPAYRHLLNGAASPTRGQARHQFLLQKLMEAARLNTSTSQGLDANVQIALGVLLNTSQDFDKAVDCFEAGLSQYPQVRKTASCVYFGLPPSNNIKLGLYALEQIGCYIIKLSKPHKGSGRLPKRSRNQPIIYSCSLQFWCRMHSNGKL
jgi:peroxin-5